MLFHYFGISFRLQESMYILMSFDEMKGYVFVVVLYVCVFNFDEIGIQEFFERFAPFRLVNELFLSRITSYFINCRATVLHLRMRLVTQSIVSIMEQGTGSFLLLYISLTIIPFPILIIKTSILSKRCKHEMASNWTP